MPWLAKDLLHVHVPRCCGTSLQKQFKVQKAATEGRHLLARAGITYLYYRYRLYEESTFPWRTWENLYALVRRLLHTTQAWSCVIAHQ